MMIIKRPLLILLALTLTLGLAACGKEAAPEGNRRERLTVALQAEPQTLDPYASSHDTTFICCETVFESLLKNVDGEYVPWLAESYEIVDDTTLRFRLRDDVLFHDGNKLTAEDVAFSLIMGAESSFTSTIFGAIDTENTVAVDERTVEVKLLYPSAPLLEGIASKRGAIVSKKAYEAMGAEAFGRAPVGTGPMRFDKWVEGDRVDLALNEDYWGTKPAFDNMTVRFILEASSRALELETGGVDIAFQLAYVDWERIASAEETDMLTGNSLGMVYLCFNNSDPVYGNELVRKAIASAIDVEAVARVAYQGAAEVATGFMAESIPGYKNVGIWKYDPAKSRELLAEAGYANGLTVKFVTFKQQYYNACIEMIASMLREVGIESTTETVDLPTFTTMNNAGELPMTVMANYASISDPANALLAWPLARTISLRHNDQHIEDMLNAAARVYSMEERIPIYAELQDYLFEKLYLLPLAFPKTGYGVRSDIGNLPFVPTGIPDFAAITFAD